MIEILEFIHNKHVIHRDIKPDNFVIGLKEKRKYIYILDFGLSKKYRSSRTLQHYQIVKSKNLTGTARYASINALNGLTQSRRDDLEAVGYVLMYFLRGKLPWQGIPVKNKEDRYRKIMEKKIQTSPEELCQGFPNEFAEYINYTRKLHFEENPDYKKLRLLFIGLLNKMNCEYDFFFDWLKEKPKINPDEGKRYMTKDGSINLEYGKDNNKKIEKKETNSSTVSGNSRKEDKEINVNHDPIVNTLPNEDDNNNNNKKNRNKNNLKSYANQIVNTNSAILNEPLNVDINDNNDNNDKVKNNNKDKKTDQDECIIF
jgi:serine/threonine protein kinase